jgi:hypothetical protein
LANTISVPPDKTSKEEDNTKGVVDGEASEVIKVGKVC